MFRKVKKKPSALRGNSSGPSSNGSASGGAASSNNSINDDAHHGASKKRRRNARRNSSSSDEEGNDNNEEGTSDLLQQIRQERDTSKSKKSSSSLLLNTSSTSTTLKNKKTDNNNNWMHQYKSSDKPRMSAQEEATRTGEYHPNNETDKQQSTSSKMNADSTQNSQISALQKQPRNKFLAGPLRATTFVRTTVRFDYQPDICKDYKETGFCGFGDTCIYLHDRGDTKTGWQMEQEYEEKKKREEDKKSREMEVFMNSMMCGEVKQGGVGGAGSQLSNDSQSNGANNTNAALLDDGIPFACHLCRGPFQNPIVTTCSHYFCEKCMQTRVREVGSGCPICQKDTHGVLNHAQKLVAKKRRLVGRDGTWEEYLERSQGGGGEDDT